MLFSCTFSHVTLLADHYRTMTLSCDMLIGAPDLQEAIALAVTLDHMAQIYSPWVTWNGRRNIRNIELRWASNIIFLYSSSL